METYSAGLKCKGYQQITVSSTALALTVPAGTKRAVIGVEAQPIRYRLDGTNPTASVGFNVKADVTFEIVGNEAIKALKMIRTGTDATVNVHYFG